MAYIGLRVPDEWLKSIDELRGKTSRSAWVRGVVLKHLRCRGVRGLRDYRHETDGRLLAKLKRAKTAKGRTSLRRRLNQRRHPSGGKRAKWARKKRRDELQRLEFLSSGVCVRGDGQQVGKLLGVGSGGRLTYESESGLWGKGRDAYGQITVMLAKGEALPDVWREWHRQVREYERARKKK